MSRQLDTNDHRFPIRRYAVRYTWVIADCSEPRHPDNAQRSPGGEEMGHVAVHPSTIGVPPVRKFGQPVDDTRGYVRVTGRVGPELLEGDLQKEIDLVTEDPVNAIDDRGDPVKPAEAIA